MDNETQTESPVSGETPPPAASTLQYITREELENVLREVVAPIPPSEPEPISVEDRVVERITGVLTQAFGPVLEAQAAERLGGAAAMEYLSDLSPHERLMVSRIPGLARAIREATQARTGAKAPRTESVYDPQGGSTGELQREIDAAFPAFEAAFGVSRAQFTKMVVERNGGRS